MYMNKAVNFASSDTLLFFITESVIFVFKGPRIGGPRGACSRVRREKAENACNCMMCPQKSHCAFSHFEHIPLSCSLTIAAAQIYLEEKAR